MPNFSLEDKVFEAAAALFPTPFYLYDERGIRQAAKAVNRAFSFAADFREYFAVKALPNPEILKILMDEGCGLDCSSGPELLLAQKVNARGEDIMFSANAMPAGELHMAQQMGALINLDDESDVDLLDQRLGIPETICLRVNPGDSLTHNTIMGSAEDSKFGFMPSQLPGALEKLKALGLHGFGLHAMGASNTLEEGYYARNANFLFGLGKELSAQTGLAFRFVNLSGGIGIPYRRALPPADIHRVASLVKEKYEDAFQHQEKVAIKTEMGRFITGPNGWLVTRAIHKKQTYRTYIGLDACASNLMRPAMYGAYHHVTVIGKRDAAEDHVYDLTGALCENNDKFAVNRPLPEITLGDLLILHDAGAHGHAMGYQYNGRLRSAEVLYTKDGQFRLIRRAETPEDYFRTLVN